MCGSGCGGVFCGAGVGRGQWQPLCASSEPPPSRKNKGKQPRNTVSACMTLNSRQQAREGGRVRAWLSYRGAWVANWGLELALPESTPREHIARYEEDRPPIQSVTIIRKAAAFDSRGLFRGVPVHWCAAPAAAIPRLSSTDPWRQRPTFVGMMRGPAPARHRTGCAGMSQLGLIAITKKKT